MSGNQGNIVVQDSTGFFYVRRLSDVYQYQNEIDRYINDKVFTILAIVCAENENEPDIAVEHKEDVSKWLYLLPILTIAIVTGSCNRLTGIIMNCDIRLCLKGAVIKFPSDANSLEFNFIERCRLLMGKYRPNLEYESMLSSEMSAEEAFSNRFISAVLDADVITSVKQFIYEIFKEKSSYQIEAILKCLKSYKLFGIDSDMKLLMEEEAKQFCRLTLKEYKKSRS